MSYRILPAADRDLDDQAAYMATQASLEMALRLYDAAGATFAEGAALVRRRRRHLRRDRPHAGIGEPWPSTHPWLAGLRVWRIQGFEKHPIFYRTAEDGIEIVRILHGARDIDSVLESEA